MYRLRRTLIIVGVFAGLLATATPVRATVVHAKAGHGNAAHAAANRRA
jgi:hypothetical protein